MILWFAVLAPIVVAEIFRSPMLDYRLVALGALAPCLEVLFGHPSIAHTLLGAATLLSVVVLATQRKRMVRRRLLGLPIGLLLHLVLDGSWTRASLFWWPAFGFEFGDRHLPEFAHSMGVSITMEAGAVAAAYWAWRRYELDDPTNRALFVSTGQLSRTVMSP